MLLNHRQRVVEVPGLLVEIARAQTEVDACLLAFDGQRYRAGEARGERLRAAHAAEAGGQNPTSGEVAAAVLATGFGESFVGALDDALGADVDPRPRGHLAVHEQALAVELVEVLPSRPLGHEVRVREQHARRIGMRLEHPNRLARLDEEGLVVIQLAQGLEDLVEAGPVTRGAADAAVDDELLGPFRDLGVEVVLQHAKRRFGEPRLAVQVGAARRAHDAPRRTARGLRGGAGDALILSGGIHG